MREPFETRFLRRFGELFYGGGGGETNPASLTVGPFGNAIGQVGKGLTDWSSFVLQPEYFREASMINPNVERMLFDAFDPQKELYNRTLQQVQDQTRSAESARGLAMTPFGSSVEGNTLSNFNIDWQNNQLGRELQGLQGATGAFGNLMQSGVMAEQPMEAAGQMYADAFKTASAAKTADEEMKQQGKQQAFSNMMSGAQEIGGMFGAMAGK